METKYVSSQQELDKLIKGNYDGLIIIENNKQEINIYTNGKAVIDIKGSAQIRSVSDSAQIRSVSGSAQIRNILDNAQLTVKSKDVIIKKAKNNSIIICYAMPKISEKDKTIKIVKTKEYKTKFSIKYFIDKYDVEKAGKYIILYKSVNPETYCDFRTGQIKYEIGKTIICPDWDENFTGECGYGLHLSPTPFMALKFNGGKVLKCKVKISDCMTVENPQYPTKVRCKQVEVLEEVKTLF